MEENGSEVSLSAGERELREEEPPGSTVDIFLYQKQKITAGRKKHPQSNQVTQYFRERYFPGVSDQLWNDWKWQVRNSFRTFAELEKISGFKRPPSYVNGNKDLLPLRITPYYASLVDFSNPADALYRCVIPTPEEYVVSPGEGSDPLHEEGDSPVPNLVHRYPDRVLFLITGFCSTYCRYCTRSHMVAKKDKSHFALDDFEPAFAYIESHPEVRDVLLSGGDPFTLSDERLDYVLQRLRRIPHVEIIRIGTKVPAVLPQRITTHLVSILHKYHPLYLSIHFTHPRELTPEVHRACEMLADAGIPLGSQTVLLKGINDNVDTMKNLMQGLLKIRVRPYYLYQCDPILGSSHFRTSVRKGLEIIKGLRGYTSGYAVPTYVIDAPGGGGKIPLLPDYLAGREEGYLLMKNYMDNLYRYPDFCTE